MTTTQPTLVLRADIIRALRETKGLESDKSTRAIAPTVGVSIGQTHADKVAVSGVQKLNTFTP